MPSFNKALKFSLLLALCSIMLACQQQAADNHKQSEKQSATKTEKSIQVTDYNNQLVSLEKPAQRIIALAPHVVENLFAIGAGDQIVGVVSYSNFPEAAKQIDIVGGYQSLNKEKILELNPDLIIGWESGNSHTKLQQLRELGFTVFVNQPDSLTDIATSLRKFGKLTGNEQQADQVADQFLNKLEQYQQQYKGAKPVTAFYQVWNDPIQTINGKHVISDAIETCGGINIYADEAVIAPVINIESILKRDPQAIIASGMGEKRPEWLDDWKKWESLTAVKQDNLFYVNPDHIQRHTTRQLLAIEKICQQFDSVR